MIDSDKIQKIASEIVVEALKGYKPRFKRQKHFRGIRKTKYKRYYRKNRVKLKRKHRIYKKLRRSQLKRRKILRHYHRRG